MAKRVAGFSLKIEVETRTHDEALKASENDADIVMLDNFSPDVSSCNTSFYLKPDSRVTLILTNFRGRFLACSMLSVGKNLWFS